VGTTIKHILLNVLFVLCLNFSFAGKYNLHITAAIVNDEQVDPITSSRAPRKLTPE